MSTEPPVNVLWETSIFFNNSDAKKLGSSWTNVFLCVFMLRVIDSGQIVSDVAETIWPQSLLHTGRVELERHGN